MNRLVVLLLVLVAVPLLLGCPGNRKIDHEANEALWQWVQEQDTNGWVIPGYDVDYRNIVVDHEFKPTRFNIAIKGDEVNPLHQRNLLDMIAMEWRNKYPANMRPRFNLRVTMYDMEINRDNELGYTEIDQDGNPETHHHRTQDVI